MNRCRLKKSTSLYRSYRIIGIKTCFVHASKQILYFTLCFSRHKSEWFETQREMGSITKRRDELRNLFAFPRGSIVIKSHTRSEKADKCFWCFCHRVCCCSLLCFFPSHPFFAFPPLFCHHSFEEIRLFLHWVIIFHSLCGCCRNCKSLTFQWQHHKSCSGCNGCANLK